MQNNVIIRNKDNPLLVDISFEVPDIPTFTLLDFDDIEVIFGSEVYTLINDPTVIRISSNGLQLQLYLGGTQEPYSHYLTITGFNSNFPNGYELTSKCLGNLSIPRLC